MARVSNSSQVVMKTRADGTHLPELVVLLPLHRQGGFPLRPVLGKVPQEQLASRKRVATLARRIAALDCERSRRNAVACVRGMLRGRSPYLGWSPADRRTRLAHLPRAGPVAPLIRDAAPIHEFLQDAKSHAVAIELLPEGRHVLLVHLPPARHGRGRIARRAILHPRRRSRAFHGRDDEWCGTAAPSDPADSDEARGEEGQVACGRGEEGGQRGVILFRLLLLLISPWSESRIGLTNAEPKWPYGPSTRTWVPSRLAVKTFMQPIFLPPTPTHTHHPHPHPWRERRVERKRDERERRERSERERREGMINTD